MRILIDARLYGLENAGLGRYTMNLVDNLAKLDKKNNYSLLLRKNYFEILDLPENFKKILADFKHYSFIEQTRLPFIIQREKPDLVHIPHFNVPVFYRGKMVVTLHDLLMHQFKGGSTTTLPLPFYLLRRWGYLYAFKRSVNGSTKIIVPSISVKNEITKYYRLNKKKVIVTYEAVDDKYLQTKISNRQLILKKYGLLDKKYFIYTGNAYPHKNLERVIDAIEKINEEQSGIYFVIACSRSIFTRRLQQKLKHRKVGKYIKLLGFVPDEEIRVLYSNSQAFIFPSLSEGFGLPGMEAIASKALVVVSDIPVFREVYKNSALYFDPTDSLNIKTAMMAVLKMDQKQRKDRIEQSLHFIKRYSWNKMAKQTLKVYEDCVSLRSG